MIVNEIICDLLWEELSVFCFSLYRLRPFKVLHLLCTMIILSVLVWGYEWMEEIFKYSIEHDLETQQNRFLTQWDKTTRETCVNRIPSHSIVFDPASSFLEGSH